MNQSNERERRARPSYLTRNEALKQPLLVVEDQASVASMQAAMLHERWGCEVHIADTLAKTRELLTSGIPYFAACCDLNLPDAPDGEVIDLLVAANIPTIAVTAAFGGETRQRIIDKGVVDYVLKTSINAYAYVSDLVGFIRKNQLTYALVVDDDQATRTLLAGILGRFRMRVLEAESAEAGLRLADEKGKDLRLALVDYHLPEMNGVAAVSALRSKWSKEHLAIIGISGVEYRLLGSEFIKNGANDFIAKPFTFEEIICRVNQNLEMLNLVEENHNAAFRDYLTGLPNRRSFFTEGPEHLQCAKNQPIAVAMLDIDHFKRINDTHGHDIGDEALCHVAALMEGSFPNAVLARLGGEEFGILMTGIDPDSIYRSLDDFRLKLANTPLELEDLSLPITASIGLACVSSPDGNTLNALLSRADTKLYEAKSGGRNRVTR